MKNSRINNRYAKALFDLAVEQNFLDQAYLDMQLVKSICQFNRDFNLLLSSPVIRTDKKQAIMNEIFGNQINKLSLSFLLLIMKKRREANLNSIAISFIADYKEFKGIKVAHLKTAAEIDTQTRDHFKSILTNQSKKRIELLEEINPELIGGYVVTIDDKQSDSSVSTKIQRLRKEFNVNDYEKGF
jgi:F-type H+-transporting ATPase subunit delta